MQKKFLPDHWQVNIEGVSVWSYFRFNHNDLPMSKYKPNYKFSLQDFIFFFKFIFLRGSNVNSVYFIAARNELLSVVEQNDSRTRSNSLVFLREDGHGIKGNVLFLEAFRYLFRKLAPFIFKSKYNLVKQQLINLQLGSEKFESNIQASVGDYYFNRFILFFLKGKTIYFSNCVIPKIERTQALHQSIELQHGVIHEEHPDYANLENNIFNVPLMCWGAFWKDKILKAGFIGSLVVGPIPKAEIKGSDEIGVFTTIDPKVSSFIMEALEGLTLSSVFIQPHPRDPFIYDLSSLSHVKLRGGMSPVDCLVPIMNDSTLIYFCVCNAKWFIYVSNPDEKNDEIKERLFNKYGAVFNAHYQIAKNTEELLNYINLIKHR